MSRNPSNRDSTAHTFRERWKFCVNIHTTKTNKMHSKYRKHGTEVCEEGRENKENTNV